MRAVVALLAIIPMAVADCNGITPRPVKCLVENQQISATGPQADHVTPLPERSTLHGADATWTGTSDYPVSFLGPPSGACMLGGSIIGTWPDSDRWGKWHFRAALRFSQPSFTVFGVHIANTGDGVKPKDSDGGRADDFHIEGSWIQHADDDCVENDYAHSGAIRDNLFDGCYVMFSVRPSSSSVDGRANSMIIDRNVGALEPMASVYKGSKPGTGGLFKWSDRAPRSS